MSGGARIMAVRIDGGVPEVRATKRILDKLLELFSYRMGSIEKAIAERYFKKIKAGLNDPQTHDELYKALIEIDNIIREELRL